MVIWLCQTRESHNSYRRIRLEGLSFYILVIVNCEQSWPLSHILMSLSCLCPARSKSWSWLQCWYCYRFVLCLQVYRPSRPSLTFPSPYSKVHRLQDQLAPRAHRTQVLESQPRQQPVPAVPPTTRTSQSKAAIAFPLVWRSPSIGWPQLGRWLQHHW